MPEKYPTKKNFCCRACGQVIGERITEGLRVGIATFLPKQSFICRCRTRYSSVSLGFACDDARDKGLAAITKTQPGTNVVKPPAVDWELLKTMCEEGELLVEKDGNSLRLTVVPKNTPMQKAADKMVETVLENRELSVEEKRRLFRAGLDSLPPEPPIVLDEEDAIDPDDPATRKPLYESAAPNIPPEPDVTEPPPAIQEPLPPADQPPPAPPAPAEDLPDNVRRMPPDEEDPVRVGTPKKKK